MGLMLQSRLQSNIYSVFFSRLVGSDKKITHLVPLQDSTFHFCVLYAVITIVGHKEHAKREERESSLIELCVSWRNQIRSIEDHGDVLWMIG